MSSVFVLEMLLISLTHESAFTCQTPESCLYEVLFEDYNRFTRPVKDPATTMIVNTSFTIEALSAIHEKNQVMDTIGFITANWEDELLRWEPSEFNGSKSLILPAKEIWLPDIYLVNSSNTKFKKTYKEDFLVVIHYTGRITWEFGGTFSTNCPLEISEYPFDTQTCTVTPGIWRYTTAQLDMKPFPVFTEYLQRNSLWNLEKTDYTYHFDTFPDGDFASTPFSFTWSRKPLFYIVNILIPTIFIIVIALCAFWLPSDCGEKVSLGITVLLAFNVLQLVITEQTPVNSDVTPKIGQLLVTVMGISTLSLLGAMFSIYFNFKSSSVRVPRMLRQIAFEGLAKLFFIQPVSSKHEKSNARNEIVTLMENTHDLFKTNQELGALLDELKLITAKLAEKEDTYIVSEWKLLAKVIDRFLFWFSTMVLLIALIYIYG